MASTLTDNKAVVEQFLEGIDNHDLSVFDELLSEDHTTGIYRSGSGEGVEGREGLKELWQEYWDAFPDLASTSTELIAEGDRVSVFRKETGTHEGAWRGIEPTGNDVTFEYAGYVVVEDGKIVHSHFLGNILDLVRQLGVEPPIPR